MRGEAGHSPDGETERTGDAERLGDTERIGDTERAAGRERPKRGSLGGTIGGIIVGFDQQIFRTTPPVQELVAKGQPVRGVSGQDPGLTVVFPEGVIEVDGSPIADAVADPNPVTGSNPIAEGDEAPASPTLKDRKG
jgi:hypothetical protein